MRVRKRKGGFLMKKSKLLILGLIALMLAGGLALASCGEPCKKGGKCTLDDRCGAAGPITYCALGNYEGLPDNAPKCDCP
jgi:hypothetical protein